MFKTRAWLRRMRVLRVEYCEAWMCGDEDEQRRTLSEIRKLHGATNITRKDGLDNILYRTRVRDERDRPKSTRSKTYRRKLSRAREVCDLPVWPFN